MCRVAGAVYDVLGYVHPFMTMTQDPFMGMPQTVHSFMRMPQDGSSVHEDASKGSFIHGDASRRFIHSWGCLKRFIHSWGCLNGSFIHADASNGSFIHGDASRGSFIHGDASKGPFIHGDASNGSFIHSDAPRRFIRSWRCPMMEWCSRQQTMTTICSGSLTALSRWEVPGGTLSAPSSRRLPPTRPGLAFQTPPSTRWRRFAWWSSYSNSLAGPQ